MSMQKHERLRSCLDSNAVALKVLLLLFFSFSLGCILATEQADAAEYNCGSCHGADHHEGNFPSCLTCHNSPQNSRRQILDSNGDGTGTGGDFLKASHHGYFDSGTLTESDCKICHDTSQHKQGVVRLNNVDTGQIYAYDPADPASAENHCLSCHDADGANGDMSPFSDGKILGSEPYKMSSEIDTHWEKAYGHRRKGLTCLGDGTPGTGCHASGHGSDYKGLLAENLTLPLDECGPYTPAQANDYKLCFDCHADYPGVTKEEVLGVRQDGSYDVDYWWWDQKPDTYYITDIATRFRDRFENSGAFYDDGFTMEMQDCWLDWSCWCQKCGDPYYVPLYTPRNMNLHYFHLVLGGFWNACPDYGTWTGAWRYRDSVTSNVTCISCHNVHGSGSDDLGWVYDSMTYTHNQSGGDRFGEIGDVAVTEAYPVSCIDSCHPLFINAYGSQKTHSWFEPPNE